MTSTIFIGFLSLVIGISVALQRTLSGLFYAAGWLTLLLGVIIHSMSKEGFLPITPWIEYSSHIGSILLVCTHSMAIALRFYEERRQHKLTLEQMTEAQRETALAVGFVDQTEYTDQPDPAVEIQYLIATGRWLQAGGFAHETSRRRRINQNWVSYQGVAASLAEEPATHAMPADDCWFRASIVTRCRVSGRNPEGLTSSDPFLQ